MKKIICLLVLSLSLQLVSYSNKISIIFRYDDYTLNSGDKINQEVSSVFEKLQIPLVIGIIPADKNEFYYHFNKEDTTLFHLKKMVKSGSVEIALHGLTHTRLNKEGEFKGVNYSEQKRRIYKGKHYLDSVFCTNVTTFIPPWNSYDANTCNALHTLGFKVISSALHETQSCEYQEICYIPQTIEDFIDLTKTLQRNTLFDGTIVLMFHPYTFSNKFSTDDMYQILVQMKLNKRIKFDTFRSSNVANAVNNSIQLKANLEKNFLSKKLLLNNILYPAVSSMVFRLINLVGYILLFIISFELVSLSLKKLLHIMINKITLIYTLSIFVLILIIWNHFLSPIKLMIMTLLLSILIAGISAFLNRYLKS